MRLARRAALACLVALALLLVGCAGGSGGSSTDTAFAPVFHEAVFDADAAVGDGQNSIDVTHASEGYFAACTTDAIPCKLQVSLGESSYNYDLPADGSPIIVPANMGNGHYTLRVMQNTDANRYIEMFTVEVDVTLESETAPFVRPNVFCNYTADSACAKKAAELCAQAQTESEAFDAVFDFVKNAIAYDKDKAASLEQATGYVPDPDETLQSGKGICFDYASLTAAMLRSQGIPTKVLTGYVSPDNIYQAWDMIYINGQWHTLHISAESGNWARADMTFAAAGAEDTIGDGSEYSDRYTY